MDGMGGGLVRGLDARVRGNVQLNRLPIAGQQMVEIAKAMSRSAQLIIMDEPTSSLASNDIQHLFDLIKRLKARNVSVIFIGHRMEGVLGLADRVVVMRDGENVGNLPIRDAAQDTIIRLMGGRKVELYPKQPAALGAPALEVRNLSDGKRIQDINFVVRHGEIVGLAGLIGTGRTEVARMIFGVDPKKTGHILVDGVEQNISIPTDAVKAGLGRVLGVAKLQGLGFGWPVAETWTLPR